MPVSDRFVYTQGGIGESLPPAARGIFASAPLDGTWTKAAPGLFLRNIMVPARFARTRVIPGLSVLTGGPYAFRFALSGPDGAVILLDSVGELEITHDDIAEALGFPEDLLHDDPNQDFFSVGEGTVRLTLCARGDDIPDAPLILSVTCVDETRKDAPAPEQGRAALPFPLPAVSQFAHDAALGRRICSPVSIAMAAAGCLGAPPETARVVALCRSPERGTFGLWPRAVWAASRLGVPGLVTNLNDWDEVAALLDAGVPIIASITYGAGELTGADVNMTQGHLLVISGIGNGRVRVHDPAAESAARVPRDYDGGEFARAWFGNKLGICYLLFRGPL